MGNFSWKVSVLMAIGSSFFLTSCQLVNDTSSNGNQQGFEVKFLAGSNLETFCDRAAQRLNQQNPKLETGEQFYLTCETKGSGDVVSEVVSLTEQLKNGNIDSSDPQFPTLISVDGEIYHAQLRYRVEQIFPGQNYIPNIPDAPLLANSPMVFMTTAELATDLRQQEDLFKTLVQVDNHQQLGNNSPALPINFVHTAPTRSNSGLQTLVAEFASVSGKAPEQMTVADVQTYQDQVREIESKIARYGTSTGSLAQDMVENGVFWASIASVYESLVIEANSNSNNNTRYEAVYPQDTFTSNLRAIVPQAPWVNEQEQAAAQQVIEFLRSEEIQAIATDLGLRPGVPGIPLGDKFSQQYGVNPNATYNSLRPPSPEVVEAMLKSWRDYAKKPSQVVVVVDSSGSMAGSKLPAVQSTLRTYIESLGPKEKIALIDFDNRIQSPVEVDGTPQGQQRGMQFITNLRADGGTRLYDATLQARNWLQNNYQEDAINAVLILTDGEDSGSEVSFQRLTQQLEKNSFSSDRRIAFFTVGYGKEGEFNPDVLQKMAELNGGYYRKGNPQTLSQLMSDLQLEF
ncbi:von Willebrand factor type A [Halothece sp. PCC 7418]|uniref:extracellular solute-binding protein n=1 Tax=Halothece sp. (strain PCC 7418) TaxID=65093 RepID=UPI0002A060CE|nr:extracellular solute-binding protein [Halothece sp. PCC 7418]AFZ44147.1 von Willebrand factor type A [Halothece sp. PCC 7418]